MLASLLSDQFVFSFHARKLKAWPQPEDISYMFHMHMSVCSTYGGKPKKILVMIKLVSMIKCLSYLEYLRMRKKSNRGILSIKHCKFDKRMP